MAIVITVATQKGGVGKTTTVVNLACALAAKPFHKRVLVVDVDPQANASTTLGTVNPAKQAITVAALFDDDPTKTFAYAATESKYKGVDLIPSNIDLFAVGQQLSGPATVMALENKLDSVTLDSYDFIIVDCPPNLGGPFVVNAMIISDYFIIPVESASIYATMGMDQFLKSIEAVKSYSRHKLEILGVLITKYDPRTTAAKVIEDMLGKRFGDLMFKTKISRSTSLEQATMMSQAVAEMKAGRRSTAAKDYKELAAEVIQRCGMELPESLADDGD